MSLDDLVTQLETSFAGLQDAVAGLTHQQKLQRWYGKWCVYDIFSHIIGWHHEMDDAFERIARGERPVPEGLDYSKSDEWNDRFVDTWVQSSGVAVEQELETSKDIFVKAARLVPEDKFEDGRAAFRIMHTTAIDHYAEHAKDIREWREREGI